jgi:hypothetical protein
MRPAPKYPEYHQAVLEWTTAVETALTPKYAAEPFGRVASYASRWETPTFASYCWSRHEVPGFTIENPYAMVSDLLLTRERYREAGRRIALSIFERLRVKEE